MERTRTTKNSLGVSSRDTYSITIYIARRNPWDRQSNTFPRKKPPRSHSKFKNFDVPQINNAAVRAGFRQNPSTPETGQYKTVSRESWTSCGKRCGGKKNKFSTVSQPCLGLDPEIAQSFQHQIFSTACKSCFCFEHGPPESSASLSEFLTNIIVISLL